MKKRIARTMLAILAIILTCGQVNAQGISNFSYGGYFDQVCNSQGHVYTFYDISTASSKPLGSSNNVISSQTCQAGYFILHYATNSYLDGSAPARSVVCQVFEDVSGLISTPAPLSSPTSTVKIHIFCGDLMGGSGGLGFGSGMHVFPINPANSTQGYIFNQVQRALLSGNDPFLNFPLTIFPNTFTNTNNPNIYYSGELRIAPPSNTNNPVVWNTSMSTYSISSGQTDLYTVVLHEVLHMVGFYTLINYNGLSKLPSGNYFSQYDKFLHTANGLPLLASNTASSCPNGNVVYSPTTTTILGAQTGTVVDFTPCGSALQYISPTTTVSVFTPTCYSPESSLAHFEDQCITPISFTPASSCTAAVTPSNTNNNLYYLMANAVNTGSCYVKRFPKPEERNVLCDLGYSVSANFTSAAIVDPISPTVTIHAYSGACSPSLTIFAQNDGLVNNVYTFTTTTTLTAISYSTILANDTPSTGLQVSCLELIYSNATFTQGASNFSVTASVGAGLVIFKYLPQNISSGQFGNPAYIFVYFILPGCAPSGACNIVENGGFENISSGSCGFINNFLVPPNVINCWQGYDNSPDLFTAGCTNTSTAYFNLGINTYYTNPPVSSHNGTIINTRAVGLTYWPTNNFDNSVQNSLAAPLVPGQSYQISLWALNHSASPNSTFATANWNNNNQSCVIAIASLPTYPVLTPTTSFPSGLNSLINFTVNAGTIWTQLTGTFTVPSTLTANQNNLLIGYNIAQTALIASPSNSSIIYTFIDDVSITAIPSVTFVIPNANGCGNTTFTNLAQYTSASNGTFTGALVTSNTTTTGTQYDFNASNTATPGTYPITLTYTTNTGCTYSLTQNIQISPAYSLSLTYTTYCPSNSQPATYSVNCSSYTGTPIYVWQPSYVSGSVLTITNTSVTYSNVINTVVAQLGNCIATQTFMVTQPPVFTQTSVTSGTTLTGPLYITSDFTLQPNTSTIFNGGEFIMGPNARIVVSNSAIVWFVGAHLYSCGADMWQGVVLKDGGQWISYDQGGNDVLIEDAVTAIDASNQATTTIIPFNSIRNTIFNKNHVDIRLGNYTANTGIYSGAFTLSKCVFTCRDLPYTATSWPSVSTSSTGLRYASTTTTGLAPPYDLQNASITNLKNPYSNQRSYRAYIINNMGLTTGTTSPLNLSGITISPGTASDFVLFDAHEGFIEATNSNIKVFNSVFQNTQTFSINSTATVAAAIQCSNSVSNHEVDLSAANTSTGNRFYNCHRAIEVTNAYNFKLENAIIRSTQSNTAISSTSFGQNGLILNSNRFYDYAVNNNEITNISNGINVNFAPGSYTVPDLPTSNFGIYHYTMAVNNNTISSQSSLTNTASSTNYVSQAISFGSPINYSNDENPGGYTITVNNNQLYRVYRGISYTGIGVSVSQYTDTERQISSNKIVLEEDANTPQQKGIDLNNNWLNDFHGHLVLETNTISLLGANTSNSMVTLLYSGFNVGSAFRYGPRITCNILNDASRGFVFEGPNPRTYWRGNKMQNQQRGMTLLNAAVIAQQGSSGNPSDNEWLGSWTGSNYGTWASSSQATNSPLYIRSGAPWSPSNSWGSPSGQSYFFNGVNTTTGSYNCGAYYPNLSIWPLPNEGDYDNSDMLYIARLTAYRWIQRHDSIKINNTEVGDFYNALGGSSIDDFTQVEILIAEGNHSAATTLLNGMNTQNFNAVENNYYSFYNLYLIFASTGSLSPGQTEDLYDLCNHCPGTNGACVFQARALYIKLKPTATFEDNCEGSARPGQGAEEAAELLKVKAQKMWDVTLFPNPAQNKITIVRNNSTEVLKITIKDLSYRIVLVKELHTKDFLVNLDIPLINGAYFITIVNEANETVTKKLLIAK